METIGIIAAMPQESDALLRLVEQRESFRPWVIPVLSASGYLDRDCWLLTSGMGIRRAAQATRALIEAASPQLLVSVGIAGAVNADLEIGDVVASTNNCVLDKEGLPGPFQPLARLSEAAWQAAELALQPGGGRSLSRDRHHNAWGAIRPTTARTIANSRPGNGDEPGLPAWLRKRACRCFLCAPSVTGRVRPSRLTLRR